MVAAALGAATANSSTAAAESASTDSTESTTDAYGDVDRGYEIAFREANGLSRDASAIRSARSTERAGNDAFATYGVPLTAAEFRHVRAGERAADHAEAVQRSVQERYPHGWAGMWVDRSRTGEAVFQYSPTIPPGVEDYVRSQRLSARFVVVDHTAAELVRIERRLEEQILDDVAGSSARVSIEQNRVDIALPMSSPKSEDDVRAQLGDDARAVAFDVEVAVPVVSRTDNRSPLTGGMGLLLTTRSTCTTGFQAWKDESWGPSKWLLRARRGSSCAIPRPVPQVCLGITLVTALDPSRGGS